MLKIAQQRKLTNIENDELDKVNKNITSILIGSEKKLSNQQTRPWSTELHIEIKVVTLWKLILTQARTKISQQRQYTKYNKLCKIKST